MTNSHSEISKASFRDPSGYIFSRNGKIFRAISNSYKENYEHLKSSGLIDKLIAENLLIPHIETTEIEINDPNIYKIIFPDQLIFVSYPYEWSFSQLKDAALLTLKIQKIALEYGMTLKDSSSFNIQFHNGKPILIDTLSFEKYVEGKPWIAYRQFCSHFLAPLLLMKYKDVRLNRLLSLFIDGVPLDLVKKLLPGKTYIRPSIFSHIFLHSLSEKYASTRGTNKRDVKITKLGLQGLIDNLEKSINHIDLRIKKSVWRNYYNDNSYTQTEFEKKQKIIDSYLNIIKPKTIIDLGANTGFFSRIVAAKNIFAISCDYDPYCVELNYCEVRRKEEKNILPLFIDLTNPSPDLGWHNQERNAFIKRKRVDGIIALALIHHLSISNNVPFQHLLSFFSGLSDYLIIEFVPKEDIQVQRLLANRKDIYTDYNELYFEKTFARRYDIIEKERLTESGRVLYLMKLK